MKLERCLGNLPDLFADTERDKAPKDSAMLGDPDDRVNQMNDNGVEPYTAPAVGVKVVGALSCGCFSPSTL